MAASIYSTALYIIMVLSSDREPSDLFICKQREPWAEPRTYGVDFFVSFYQSLWAVLIYVPYMRFYIRLDCNWI